MELRLFNNNPKVYLLNLSSKYKCTLIKFSFDNGRFFDQKEYKGITHLLEHCLYHTLKDCYDNNFEIRARTYDNELCLFVKMPRGKRLIPFMAAAVNAITNFNPSQVLMEREKQEILKEVGEMTFVQKSLDRVYQYCLGDDTAYDSGYYIGSNFRNINMQILMNFWQKYVSSTNLTVLIGLPRWSIYWWRFKSLKQIFTNSPWLLLRSNPLPNSQNINKDILIENTEGDTIFCAITFPGIPSKSPFIEKLTVRAIAQTIVKRLGKDTHLEFNGMQNALYCIYFTSTPENFSGTYTTLQNVIKDFKKGTAISFVELDDYNYDDAYDYAVIRDAPEDTFRLAHNYLNNTQPTLNLKSLKRQIYARTPEFFKNIAIKYFSAEQTSVIILKPTNFQLDKNKIKLDF